MAYALSPTIATNETLLNPKFLPFFTVSLNSNEDAVTIAVRSTSDWPGIVIIGKFPRDSSCGFNSVSCSSH
jgi:hypothetical protein